MTDNSECIPGPVPEAPDWVADGGFVAIGIGVMIMFWGLTFICEEYCVPAITVFCRRNNISDDVAGALFIGTGLSLPVLFASFVGLFISNSAIGVGTVVGGDIFNHLINIAVSINSAPTKTLKLDGLVFTREMAFYFLSCLLVVWAAKGNLINSFESMLQRDQWLSCLSIHWLGSLVLVLCYFLYCFVDCYFLAWKGVVLRCYARWKAWKYSHTSRHSDCASDAGPDVESPEDDNASVHSASDANPNPNRNSLTRRRNNTDSNHLPCLESGDVEIEIPTLRMQSILENSHSHSFSSHSHGLIVDQIALAPPDLGSHIALPQPAVISYSDEVDLTDFSMFVRSSFFFSSPASSCIPMSRAWKIRYFTFNSQSGLYYRLDYYQPQHGPHVRFIDIFDLDDVTVTNHELMEFTIRLRTQSKVYAFRANHQSVFQAIVQKLSDFLFDIKKRNESELRALAMKSMFEISNGQEEAMADPDNEAIGESAFVVPAQFVPKVIYFATLPLKGLVYLTVPDVRKAGRENQAILSISVSFVWLGLLTYVLIEGLSMLADLLRVNGSVMGLTVGAWAASYPALWSSVVVARSGFGDMAVCNALGSNVFANLIGLGLPWLAYVLIHNKPYSVLEDDGVVLSLTGLMIILVASYVLIAVNRWVLKSWMVPLFVVTYVVYIGYFIYFTVSLS